MNHDLELLDDKGTLIYYRCRSCGCIFVKDDIGVMHHSAVSPFYKEPINKKYIPSCSECKMHEALS